MRLFPTLGPLITAAMTLAIVAMTCKHSTASAASKVEVVTVHSAGLEKNLLGDSPDQQVAIYLPAEYAQKPNQRFAVVYFLHGFDDMTCLAIFGPADI
jgi:hypothetical protein